LYEYLTFYAKFSVSTLVPNKYEQFSG